MKQKLKRLRPWLLCVTALAAGELLAGRNDNN